ncbi:MAG: ribonuclease III domain-containing protein [Ruthenibacterium sp.]
MLFSADSQIDIHEQSPIALAFVGDGVFELLVRTRLVEHTRLVPNQLHAHAVRLVSAKGQARGVEAIEPLLTEQEQAVLRRGKNSTKASVAKHATPQQYRASTALEALFGWLYLQNQNSRIEELFNVIWDAVYEKTAPQTEKGDPPSHE